MIPVYRQLFLCLLLIAGSRCALATPVEEALQRAANEILRHQTSDGAIVVGKDPAQPAWVTPYVGNLAAIGLVSAYRKTHNAVYKHAVRRWVDWYEARLNADGTIFDVKGSPGAWKSTGDYDSTDSYAATYLSLLLEVYRAEHDLRWLRERSNAAQRALTAIRRVLQPNGLTIAKPTYPVMYVMDNVETLQGLRAAASVQHALGDREAATGTERLASDMEAAIARHLWSPELGYYRVALQTDGGKEEGLAKWYPDVMANLMAVAWLPPSARNRELFGLLKARFGAQLPAAARSEDDLERLVWWGMAAQGAADAAFLGRIVHLLRDPAAPLSNLYNPALAGHLCRFMNP